MAAFILLLLFCLISVVGGCIRRRVDWQAIERENERYYTADGYHIYYDRKSCAIYGKRNARRRRK